jgi:hypothetical protein
MDWTTEPEINRVLAEMNHLTKRRWLIQTLVFKRGFWKTFAGEPKMDVRYQLYYPMNAYEGDSGYQVTLLAREDGWMQHGHSKLEVMDYMKGVCDGIRYQKMRYRKAKV